MSMDTLRKQLHILIDNSSEEKLQEVYNLLEKGNSLYCKVSLQVSE